MKKNIFFSILILALVLLQGCKDAVKKDNRISEGVISYNAELVDATSPMADVAPSKMIVKFKNNYLKIFFFKSEINRCG